MSPRLTRTLCIASVVAALFVCCARVDAATLRVPQDHASIQLAIQAASNGDVIDVAAGTWFETIDFLGKDIHVRSVDGPSVTIIDAGGAGAVATFQNSEAAAVLEGFTLRGGTGAVLGNSTFGGGVFAFTSSPTIRGNVIESNEANFGGGIACIGAGSARIEGNIVRSNKAFQDPPSGRGGGVYIADGAFPILEGNEIAWNTGQVQGGGVWCGDSAQPFLVENDIHDNLTSVDGGGIAVVSDAFVLLRDCELRGNRSANRGGAIHVEEATIDAAGNRMTGNFVSQHGGAICLLTGSDASVFERNRIERNRASKGGGGVYVTNSRPFFASNLVAFNESGCDVGNCGGGGLFASVGGKPLLVNETYYGNTADHQGGAIYSHGLSKPVLVNCILWQNTDAVQREIVVEVSNILVEFSIVRDGWPGVGNLAADPRFVDAPTGDFHLRIDSPAIDAGTQRNDLSALDLDGGMRVVDGDGSLPAVVDLGADELEPGIAVRYGTVGAASGSVESVLHINGSAGDVRREIITAPRSPLTIDLAGPSAGPDPAGFVLYVFEEAPDPTTVRVLPRGVGAIGFAIPLQGGQPLVVWNNVGHHPKLGMPDLPSSPAPTRVVDAPGGVALELRVYVQGILFDDGSEAGVPASVTNGIVLRISEP